MNDEESVDMLLDSGEWYAAQAAALIKQYKVCRTERARQLLMPKLKHMAAKLGFERRGLAEIIGDNEGEEWKNET